MKMTLDDINRAVVSADYHVFPETTVTVCCLKLRNGFCVVGYSACIDPAEFDEAMGRSEANKVAIEKVWELEGYLAVHLRSTGQAPVIAVIDEAPEPVFVQAEPPAADIAPIAPLEGPTGISGPAFSEGSRPQGEITEEQSAAIAAADRAALLDPGLKPVGVLTGMQEIKHEDVGQMPDSLLDSLTRADGSSADVPPRDSDPA